MDGSLGFPERPWERPWERWTPRGNAQYSSSASRQSEITLEVSMRDIILNSKESMSINPRWSFESTRTETREESPESNHGGEKGKHPGPPPPVGFWDPRLKKTRVEICKAWMKTSEYVRMNGRANTETVSFNFVRLYSWGFVNVLGRPLPCQRECFISHCLCGRLRWHGTVLERHASDRSIHCADHGATTCSAEAPSRISNGSASALCQ